MIYPNYNCYLYCLWLLNSSYQRFSVSQVAQINAVATAAQTGGTVTLSQYNYFTYFTAPYYRAYLQWFALSPNNPIPSGYDALTTAWLGSITTPAAQTIYAVDTFFKQLRNDNNLLLDYFFLFAQGSQANARVSLINPTLYAITEHNAPTWAAFLGYTGDAASMYLSVNYVDSVNGVNFTQGNGSFGAYMRLVIGTAAQSNMGSYNGTVQSVFRSNYTTGIKSFAVNHGGYDTFASTATQGLHSVLTVGAPTQQYWLNGIQLYSTASTNILVSTKQDFIMCYNNNGAAAQFDNNQYACAFKGSGAINQVLFNSAVNTLMTNLGAHY